MRLPADIVARVRSRLDGLPVCVTGGAGFIGGHLVDALLAVGANVTVIDDLSSSTAEHLGELIDMDAERVRFVHGSILDDDALDEAVRGSPSGPARVVFHLAAIGSVARSVENPQRTWSVNSTGTVRVLEAARAADCRRIVFAASSSAYGGAGASEASNGNSGGAGGVGGGGAKESMLPHPVSPYAASKLAGEAAMEAWARTYGLSTVRLRLFNIFGPRQPADSAYAAVVAAFAKKLLANEPPTIYGDGHQTRDFTFIANAVLAFLLAGSTERVLAGEALNIGTGSRVSLRMLAEKMAVIAGASPGTAPVSGPERPGDVRHSLANIAAARELLNYEPFATLDEGLTETVRWYKEALAGA